MLSTSSSTSPGRPSTRPITTTAAPVAASTPISATLPQRSGPRTCCSRCNARRYAAPIAPLARPTTTDAPSSAGRHADDAVREPPSTRTYRSTIYQCRRRADPDDVDYRRLLEFRTGIRHFLHWSEEQALAVGVTPAQHQLMLAIRGHAGPERPTIGDIADALVLRHNSAVGLDRPRGRSRPRRARRRRARLARRPAAAHRARQPADPSAQPRAPRGAAPARPAHGDALGRPRP